jgi:hypothetical protein
MKIFLFDMDGVLLESHGYHLALQETIHRIAMVLGFEQVILSLDDMATFEAGGITSEWDEAAIITALLLETIWKSFPDRVLPDSLGKNAIDTMSRKRPDFTSLAHLLSAPDMLNLHPLKRAERHFLSTDHFTQTQSDILLGVIRNARNPQHSLTHRTFQELVLGSREYGNTYGLSPVLDCEGYLLKHDISNLTHAESAQLKDWLSAAGHSAAVFTSRPSKPPAGVFSTPEAELGALQVGLEDIPIAGWGGITWLGNQYHTEPQIFVKPSPVHALAALRMALGDGQETAFTAAVELVRNGQAGATWRRLDGSQVCVFEDSTNGIKSLKTARQVLDGVGIHIETKNFGIATNSAKIQTLIENGAQVFPSLVDALGLSID